MTTKTPDTATHYAFSDESHQNTGQFRGLGLLTATKPKAQEIGRVMQGVLLESGLKEFKWERLKTQKVLFAAKKIVDLLVGVVEREQVRIDVLVWDTRDGRHDIKGRDDRANLERMYYHLLKTVLVKRWPEQCAWCLFPDENRAIDWDTLRYFLERKAARLEFQQDLATGNESLLRLVDEFRIHELSERQSHDEVLIQIADLFVGLCIFSHSQYDKYEIWRVNNGGTQDMFVSSDCGGMDLSNAERTRSDLLHYFNKACKRRKLRVSLDTHRGLVTRDFTFPIGFWLWEAQHDLDKAPTKSETRHWPEEESKKP